MCKHCGKPIAGYTAKNGKEVTAEQAAVNLKGLCQECYRIQMVNA